MRLAMIARFDNSGLGTLSWEFANHLKPHKVLLVENGVFQTFPERYSQFATRKIPFNGSMSQDDMNWLCEGVDIIFSIETFYSDIIPYARKRGVKTVLIPMCEMTADPQPRQPDLLICPSKLDMQMLEGRKIFLPIPVNTEKLIWKRREKARVFVHTASHGGMNLRKGTPFLLEAMQYVKSAIKLIVYSWMPFSVEDDRVEVRRVNFKNYWQCWQEGDVLVYPQDYNGICLPIIEAMSSGLGVITTDIFPFNEYMPKPLLFQPESMYRTRAAKGLLEMDAAKIDSKRIAQKIDEWYDKDISEFSEYGGKWAEENSWKKLLPKYQHVLNTL